MHTRAKISVTFWLVASALIAILVLANKQRWYYALEVDLGAAVGMLMILIWRLWAVRQLNNKQTLHAQRRLAKLRREVNVLGQPVRIEGMGPTLWLALGIVITALFVVMYVGAERIIFLMFAIFSAIAVLIAALIRISKLGQPLLIVSREGVQPAGFGLLPWSAIHSIGLNAQRKHASGTTLNLYVPGLKAHLHSAHPITRFFRSIPGIWAANYVDVIIIPMRKPSELPWVIEQLCRRIWKEEPRSDELKELHAQLVREQYRNREAWARIWTVPGAFALALLVGQVPFGRLVAFVPNDSWSTQAFVIAAALVIIAWSLIIGRARNVFGEFFTRTRLVQVLVTLGLTTILVLPMTWLLITDIGGVMAAYDAGSGPNEQITVIAAKKERNSRRGCDYVLTHPGLGRRMCLIRAQFLTHPSQVPVVLSIRRNALGYKVYEQRIASSPQ